MIEVALVFDQDGKAIFWPSVPGSAGSIPDNRNLWDRLWENRRILGGVAHTHPWIGEVWPSATDLTTFSAIERGLGRKLIWPILTLDQVKYYVRSDDEGTYSTTRPAIVESAAWNENMKELRRLSQNGG